MTGVGRSGRGKMETTVLEQKERKKERKKNKNKKN